jgi:hypothetical protein
LCPSSSPAPCRAECRICLKSMIQWVSESMDQWLSESMNQWVSEHDSLSEWFDEPTNQWTTNPWINESVNEWTNDSMNQWNGWVSLSELPLCWATSSLTDIFTEVPLLFLANYFFSGQPLIWATCALSCLPSCHPCWDNLHMVKSLLFDVSILTVYHFWCLHDQIPIEFP